MGPALGIAFPEACRLLGNGYPRLQVPLSPPVPVFRAGRSCSPVCGLVTKNLGGPGLVLGQPAFALGHGSGRV